MAVVGAAVTGGVVDVADGDDAVLVLTAVGLAEADAVAPVGASAPEAPEEHPVSATTPVSSAEIADAGRRTAVPSPVGPAQSPARRGA